MMRTVYDEFSKVTVSGQTLDEFLRDAGLDFPVAKGRLTTHYTPHGANSEEELSINSDVATIRTDKGIKLGIVGKDYGLDSYSHKFSLIEPMLEDGTARVIYARPINYGARAYVVLRGSGALNLGDTDVIENYFYIKSSYDGSCSLEVKLTPVRKVDGTVLPIGSTLKMRHSKGIATRVDLARRTISKIRSDWDNYEKVIKELIKVTIQDEEAEGYIEAVMGDSNATKAINARDRIFTIYKAGIISKFPASNGTLFGAMQAILYWVDNHKTVRKSITMDDDSARVEARLYKDGALKKGKAYDEAFKKAQAMGFALKLKRR